MLPLTSPAFMNGEAIPVVYTCEGAGISPALMIAGVPDGAQSLALIMDDPDAVGGTFDHWVLYDIAPGTAEIPEGGFVGTEGRNGAGKEGYYHPCPPRGHEPEEHRYSFRLYALDSMLGLPHGISKHELQEAMNGHVIEQTELTGRYRKQH